LEMYGKEKRVDGVAKRMGEAEGGAGGGGGGGEEMRGGESKG